MAAVKVKIPDFMANWPFKRQLNSHYRAVRAASREWLRHFSLFEGKPYDAFHRCNFHWLAMLSYPKMNPSMVGCGLMILFYAFDEYTDVENGVGVRELADTMIDALHHRHKPRPAGEIPFWSRALPLASPMSQRHFLQTMEEYANGCVQQAHDRATDRVRTIDDYWAVRRLTSGYFPTFTMIELDLDFPEEVYMHPLLVRLREIVMQSVYGQLKARRRRHADRSCRRMYSYNIECRRGHELHNIITDVMHGKNLNLPDAVAWMVKSMREQWGEEISRRADRYVEGLGEWAKGNDC
ncbi:isoprenoid synthase domain-containing protein [Immersiella caudata]|uniref:Isoprenoid synthase domain-containing protein n=1 Tax=Immersiella caudata TaxID=314043 RepID=A0AA39XII2_9PEZI|nr:isoprenoid synthase domain-containing protein [Immersiella caudata]